MGAGAAGRQADSGQARRQRCSRPGRREPPCSGRACLEEALVCADRLVSGQHHVGLDGALPLPALGWEPQVVLLQCRHRRGRAGGQAGSRKQEQTAVRRTQLWKSTNCQADKERSWPKRAEGAQAVRQAEGGAGREQCSARPPGWLHGPGRCRRTPRSSCRSRSPPRAASGPAWSAAR